MFRSTDKYNCQASKQWISKKNKKRQKQIGEDGLAHTQISTLQRNLLYITTKIKSFMLLKKDDRFVQKL